MQHLTLLSIELTPVRRVRLLTPDGKQIDSMDELPRYVPFLCVLIKFTEPVCVSRDSQPLYEVKLATAIRYSINSTIH